MRYHYFSKLSPLPPSPLRTISPLPSPVQARRCFVGSRYKVSSRFDSLEFRGGQKMFPIGDDDSSRRTVPVVTYALIALNLLFFFVELSSGESFIEHWSVVPDVCWRILAAISSRCSRPCSCMPAGYICWATCSTYGSLVITWKTALVTSNS